jgi:hypothetical protein
VFYIVSFVFSIGHLCIGTPAMTAALEIGSSAEQYIAEGHYQKALDKFQSCLGILIPLLSNEPKGHRRDLLYSQIQLWMKQAESTKALLCVLDLDDASIPENKGNHSCEHLDKSETCLSFLEHKIILLCESLHFISLYLCEITGVQVVTNRISTT